LKSESAAALSEAVRILRPLESRSVAETGLDVLAFKVDANFDVLDEPLSEIIFGGCVLPLTQRPLSDTFAGNCDIYCAFNSYKHQFFFNFFLRRGQMRRPVNASREASRVFYCEGAD